MVWNESSRAAVTPTSTSKPTFSVSTPLIFQHSKNQLRWNEFNPQVSSVTPSACLRAPGGGAEAWLMTWPLHGPRMTSSWGSRHLARRNSQRDVKVLPSEAHRGLRGVPLHSMLHSLSWSTRRNCRSEKSGDKQGKQLVKWALWEKKNQENKQRCTTGVILKGFVSELLENQTGAPMTRSKNLLRKSYKFLE